MTEKKTLFELGVEYEESARQIKSIIMKKREELRGLFDSVCSTEAYDLKRELRLLYEQHRELSEIADYLKRYYEPHKGRRELFSCK